MNIFKNLGFRKADEREMYIANKSLRFAMVFYIIALIVWAAVELILNKGATSIFFILLYISFIGQGVYWIFHIYYTKKNSG